MADSKPQMRGAYERGVVEVLPVYCRALEAGNADDRKAKWRTSQSLAIRDLTSRGGLECSHVTIKRFRKVSNLYRFPSACKMMILVNEVDDCRNPPSRRFRTRCLLNPFAQHLSEKNCGGKNWEQNCRVQRAACGQPWPEWDERVS